MSKRIIIFVLLLIFSLSTTLPLAIAQELLTLPSPGTMVELTPQFTPILLRGMQVDLENPFRFNFIVDTGDTNVSTANIDFRNESKRLISYFLTALTVPEKDLWVNLSPYEKERIISPNLGQTQMGNDMLSQDYLLKQLTASLLYPEKELGRNFWDQVYRKAKVLYGSVDIPVNTFNKVWIVADYADLLQKDKGFSSIYIENSKTNGLNTKDANNLGSQIIRQVILPEIEREINNGKNFISLRQMYYSMILASWYKLTLKDSLLNKIYGNRAKVKAGITIDDPKQIQLIYDRYLRAFKKGVFNYIKEDIDPVSNEIELHKYFSGGLEIFPGGDASHILRIRHDEESITSKGQFVLEDVQFILASESSSSAISLSALKLKAKEIMYKSGLEYSDHNEEITFVIAIFLRQALTIPREERMLPYDVEVGREKSKAVLQSIVEDSLPDMPQFTKKKITWAFKMLGLSNYLGSPEDAGLQRFFAKINRAANELQAIQYKLGREYTPREGKNSASSALIQDQNVGGIDLNSKFLSLKTLNASPSVPISFPVNDLTHIDFDGLYPVILNITPIFEPKSLM